ncbi:MAG: PqqD family peptide modification chaperone [Desulfuromonadales bacterium]|nr:PqqD family peptide modification chaperone [Desulfuromonadales bacterium]
MVATPVIALQSRIAINPGLVLRIEADDYALLFDPDSGRVQILNETAVDIWQRLDGCKTLAEVLAELRHGYDASDADIEAQLLELMQTLFALGAIEVREPV